MIEFDFGARGGPRFIVVEAFSMYQYKHSYA